MVNHVYHTIEKMVTDRRTKLENQISELQIVFSHIKNINTLEEFEDFKNSIDKKMSYLQARIEENDTMQAGIDTIKANTLNEEMKTEENPPPPDIELKKDTDPAYVVRWDDGSFAITPSVTQRIRLMNRGERIVVSEFYKDLLDKKFIQANSISGVHKAFRSNKNIKKVDYGIYERL